MAIRVVYKSNFLDHTSVISNNPCTQFLFDLVKFETAMHIDRAYNKLLPLNLIDHFSHTPAGYLTRKNKHFHAAYSANTEKQLYMT